MVGECLRRSSLEARCAVDPGSEVARARVLPKRFVATDRCHGSPAQRRRRSPAYPADVGLLTLSSVRHAGGPGAVARRGGLLRPINGRQIPRELLRIPVQCHRGGGGVPSPEGESSGPVGTRAPDRDPSVCAVREGSVRHCLGRSRLSSVLVSSLPPLPFNPPLSSPS